MSRHTRVLSAMVSKEAQPPVVEVSKKSRRRGRRAGSRAGSRAAKRRARKASSQTIAAAAIATSIPEKLGSPAKCAVHAFLLKYQSAMRKIPAQLPPKVHAGPPIPHGPPSKRVKRVSWRK